MKIIGILRFKKRQSYMRKQGGYIKEQIKDKEVGTMKSIDYYADLISRYAKKKYVCYNNNKCSAKREC